MIEFLASEPDFKHQQAMRERIDYLPLNIQRLKLQPIPWPVGLKPTPVLQVPYPKIGSPLPNNLKGKKIDAVIVTWTVAEALALSDVLTPTFRSNEHWYDYTSNWATFEPLIRNGAPAKESRCLGKYFFTTIGEKLVLCFKSELHMSQDGPQLPVLELFKQIVAETQTPLILSVGTAGGIGDVETLGDVIVPQTVKFDCKREFKNAPFVGTSYNPTVSYSPRAIVHELIDANVVNLPAAKRNPRIYQTPITGIAPMDVVTTDFFGFDTAENFYGLKGIGAAVEMGDAVLGLAISEISNPPKWGICRNVSDPQIPNTGTIQDQDKIAGQIYTKYGYWTSLNSSIAAWAIITQA